MDRTVATTDKAGTAEATTTDFAYLGLTDQVASEEIAGQLQRTYQYDAFGRRLTQLTKDTDGAGPEVAEDSYYGYNPHTDVETLTGDDGDTKATYGYTAYGKNDDQAFTGIDKPDAQNPGKEPFNFYRYNGKRYDPASGSYDMGFRDYNPGINRFTTRDMYNGALADLNLGTNPFTGNRYAFTSGNPISRIELDGHDWFDDYLNTISTPPTPADPNAPPGLLGTSGPSSGATPARPPAVSNDKLRDIVKDSYARPQVESGVGRGTTADALRYELDTGNQVEGKWHYQKAVQQFGLLAEWLDEVRKGNITATDADIRVAKTEAGDLWDALNTADRTGNVVADIKAKDATGNHNFRNTLWNATGKAAVSYLTGVEFEYDERGKPTRKGPPKFTARGFVALDLLGFAVDVGNRGFGDAVFDLFDVTGIGRQYLDMPQCPPAGCVA